MGALGLGFGLLPIIPGIVQLLILYYLQNCLQLLSHKHFQMVLVGPDPSPITFLIHSGQEENNPSSLNALH